jgi:type II restriction/modification system DNA methylase subunit YeeA
MKSLPIKDVSLDEQSPLITVVDKIHKKLKTDINANVSDLEKQIDELVYKLYDLTEEEIAIIENSLNKT